MTEQQILEAYGLPPTASDRDMLFALMAKVLSMEEWEQMGFLAKLEPLDREQVRREVLLAGALHFQHGWNFEERLPISRIIAELRRLATEGHP